MLKSKLIHPEISAVLARAGHGAKVLIADGNYPASSRLGPVATQISLNLCPGKLNCTDVLDVLLSAIPVEVANTMAPEPGSPYVDSDPNIWKEFESILRQHGIEIALQPIDRFEFYNVASDDHHVLTIQTGDTRLYANLLLTIGVRKH